MSRNARYGVGIAVLLAGAAVVGYQARERGVTAGDAEVAAERAAPPLFDNLGSYHRPVSTGVADAQRYFDQGLRLTYAFNHGEAIRAFEQATELDPDCAICYWGIAYAYGPNINAPMDRGSALQAYAAVQEALSRVGSASPVERALIEALAVRYAAEPPEDRVALDRAYAGAMREVRQRFPHDHDVVTLHAEAVMNLSPWDYWTRELEPRPGTAEVVADLERVLAASPDHPGACHYYIHAVEAAYPERAVDCAERLASLMPGAGHLVHMPAHIYIRVGRWADAIRTNEHAVHSDETYIADQGPTGVYPVAYYPHNYHFLSFAATMAGRSAEAIRAARGVVERVPVEVARQVPPVEPLLPYVHLVLVTFGRWDDVLSEPEPPADLMFATAMTRYARGVAHAARNEGGAARDALDAVRSILAGTEDPLNSAVLDIARHALEGEIAFRVDSDLRSAEAHFRQAAALEDELLYMEPPHWYYPIRHSLGAVLLAQGRAAEAEAVYHEDLKRFPENAWSLAGLQRSLQSLGRHDESAAIATRIAALGSDVQLAASRY
jgi:tetratricopeptide (TPR) repeat protein